MVAQAISEAQESFTVLPVMTETISQALALAQKYQYSYYDSLILASALSAGCSTLFNEDMQYGQVIENSLTIDNPLPNDCNADPISPRHIGVINLAGVEIIESDPSFDSPGGRGTAHRSSTN